MGNYRSSFDDVVDTEYTAGTITVGTTEVLACANGSTNLSKRQEITIYNKSVNTIYFGPTGVTASNGIPIVAGEVVSLQYGPNLNIYLIAASAGNSIIIQEAS